VAYIVFIFMVHSRHAHGHPKRFRITLWFKTLFVSPVLVIVPVSVPVPVPVPVPYPSFLSLRDCALSLFSSASQSSRKSGDHRVAGGVVAAGRGLRVKKRKASRCRVFQCMQLCSSARLYS